MRIDAHSHLRVVAATSVVQEDTAGSAWVPAVMSPLEAAQIYAAHADELAATVERLAELNRQQSRLVEALSAAFGELHVVADELVNALGE